MSEQLPANPDIRQLRTQAKELLSALHNAEPDAIAQAKREDPSLDPSKAILADAQRLIARNYGFSSWPKMVNEVETPQLIEKFREALRAGNATQIESLLEQNEVLRGKINEPIMGFDAPPIVAAASHANATEVVAILVRYGADPNARSKWWAGGFSALDGARGDTVDQLLQLGARFDVWSAAAHGRIDVLEQLLDADPSQVNAPGGDGEHPLHFASTPEVVDFLVSRGADVEARDVDHESTPIQYQIERPEICQALVKHGAAADIFTAVVLDDVPLLQEILSRNPEAAHARVGKSPFVTTESSGGHIYLYKVGSSKTPQIVAAERGLRDILHALDPFSPVSRKLIAAAWLGDETRLDKLMATHPEAQADLEPEDRAALATAAAAGKTEAIRLLLKAGFDPLAPGMDTGSALHMACWFGYPEAVKLLIPHVPLDLTDQKHLSPPLGWACHGAQWCGNPKGDYVAVVEELIAAGADPNAPGNLNNTPMLKMAGGREDVKQALRRLGAK